MACFTATVVGAAAVTIAARAIAKKEGRLTLQSGNEAPAEATQRNIPFSRKLQWLSNLLWGGSLLLAFEHVWHGEIVPWFPFLTAASNPADAMGMLHEIATVGVCMTLVVTLVWAGMLLVSNAMEKQARAAAEGNPSLLEGLQ
ncbi:MAG: hypothetical protein FWF60_02195 [Oscillospiraceae bacterium]|nr:hypothetical protein [Oscillospiraceae bacterium]